MKDEERELIWLLSVKKEKKIKNQEEKLYFNEM